MGFLVIVTLLAELKAEAVGQEHIGYILGCDRYWSVLKNFNKPKNMVEAKAHLSTLQGRKHLLITACVCSTIVSGYGCLSTSALTMRALSETELIIILFVFRKPVCLRRVLIRLNERCAPVYGYCWHKL